jgi:ATP-binding cassette subfamily C (CFTR/MRP) protein 1
MPQVTRTRLIDEVGDSATAEVGTGPEDVPPAAPQHSCVSELTFSHFSKIIRLGRRRPLQNDDLPDLPPDDSAQRLARRFSANLRRHGKVWRALVATFGRQYLVAGLCKFPQDCCIFVSPFLLKRLIRVLEMEEPRLQDGLLIVCGILLTGLVQSFCLQQYFHRVYRVGYNRCSRHISLLAYRLAP